MKAVNVSVKYDVVAYKGLTTCDLDECGQPITKVHELYVNGRHIGDFGYVCARKVLGEIKGNQRRLEDRFD